MSDTDGGVANHRGCRLSRTHYGGSVPRLEPPAFAARAPSREAAFAPAAPTRVMPRQRGGSCRAREAGTLPAFHARRGGRAGGRARGLEKDRRESTRRRELPCPTERAADSPKPGPFPTVAASLTATAAIALSLAIALDSACSSSPKACHTASDCNSGCCVLHDANTATGVCGDPDSSGQCLCIENQDCPGSNACCQPFIDESGRLTQAQVCATSHDSAGLFECCEGGGPICAGSNCCVHMSTGGEYCSIPCDSDADCNGGSCVGGSPVDIFGCGNGKYCGPGVVTTSSSSSSSSSSGTGGSGSGGSGAGTSTSSSSSSGLPAGSACKTSPECNSGCCGLLDAGAATGACVGPSDGVACLCIGSDDCPGSNACCEPFLDATGRATNAQTCATSPGGDPYALQCCQGGVTSCQGTLCCANMSTGGEYCAKPCSTDTDCYGGHCVAGQPGRRRRVWQRQVLRPRHGAGPGAVHRPGRLLRQMLRPHRRRRGDG